METNITNIGSWTAKVEFQGKKYMLKVHGEFPYIGEERQFELTRNVTQGINRNDLILTLTPNKPVNANGTNVATVFYLEEIKRKDQFETVTVPGPRDESIAFIRVEY